MTTGAKIGFTLLGLLVIGIPVTVLIVRNKQSNSAVANTASSASSTPIAPPCTPFSQSQQNAQKGQLQADCAKKLLIPFIGEAQFAACMKAVKSQLTPVSNC